MKNLFNILLKFLGLKKKRKYGCRKDKHDHRDILFMSPSPEVIVKLPEVVDLRDKCPPVYTQGKLGSCTANALGATIDYILMNKNNDVEYMPSRLFIYYNEREIEGNIARDCGSHIRTGIKAVNQSGACKEELHPYIESAFAQKPSEEAYKEASLHKSLSYKRLNNNIDDLKSCLADGNLFMFGMMVYEYFESKEMATTGILKSPNENEKLLGGHAVVCVGYDDTKKMFIIRNSWGEQWGIKGYFYMPYDYMSNPKLVMDLWTIESITK